ncbi:MAG: hypothetical protein H7123_01770 [Thermoleophilia bacterium]|nr:hypothetical protein [Thermoleophilia bacterium]
MPATQLITCGFHGPHPKRLHLPVSASYPGGRLLLDDDSFTLRARGLRALVFPPMLVPRHELKAVHEVRDFRFLGYEGRAYHLLLDRRGGWLKLTVRSSDATAVDEWLTGIPRS